VELVERCPSPHEYVRLREAVGWPSPQLDDCARALEGSLAAVCVVSAAEVVGMGRLVGDGAMYCFAVDVVIEPAHQGSGLGRAIMAKLEAIAKARRLGERVDLVAAPDVSGFYRRLGYTALGSELMRTQL
jgi:ribosomal protein S18 acetylase RimI-like enzyme